MDTAWFVIANPISGSGNATPFIKELESFMLANGLKAEICDAHQKMAFDRAMDGINKGFRKLLICGGDGTMNQVLNAIFHQQVVAPDEILISFIPFGTGNDWVKSVAIPIDPQEALKVLIRPKERRLDIGYAECQWGEETKKAYFANIAGLGYDAFVVEGIQKKKRKMGKFTYLITLFRLLLKYKATQMQIQTDSYQYSGKVFSACVGKGRFNGNGMEQCPHAKLDNGKLAVTVIKDLSVLEMLRETPRLYDGSFVKNEKIDTFSTEEIRIASNPKVRLECDGELLGFSPFYFKVLPGALRILVP